MCRKFLSNRHERVKARWEHVFRIGLIVVTCEYRVQEGFSTYLLIVLVGVGALIPNLGLVISLGTFIER